LLAQPLPAPDGDRELALAQLVRFFRLPAAELLKRRLGVHLDDWSRDRSDREPMELDPLEEWHLGQALLRHELEDLDPETSLLLLRASGALPLGTPGDVRYEDLRRIVDPIRSAAKAWCGPEPLPPLDVDLQVGNTRVTGSIGGRWPRAVALPQYAKLGAKHLLGSWIRHVALCAAAPTDQEPKSVVIARADKGSAARVAVFRPVQDARARLRDLVELYFIGQREPLLLFPKSSLAFTQTFAATGDLEAALREAHRPWTERFGGERDEPHLQRLFGDADVFAPDYAPLGRTPTAGNFATIAVRVFEPMLAHMREES
jgi:exodeoxyribonuclease V gamma subunit